MNCISQKNLYCKLPISFTPAFYGWYVVLASSLIALWAGLIFYGMTAFVNPIIRDLSWSYFAVSIAASIRSVEMGVIAPLTGFLADRLGPRIVVFSCGVVTGCGFLLLSMINTLLMFYLGFFVLSLGFSGLGHSVVLVAIANWFRKKLGKALGFTISGYGMSGLFIPLIVKSIEIYGWLNVADSPACISRASA